MGILRPKPRERVRLLPRDPVPLVYADQKPKSEEARIRDLVVPILRERYPGARIIHEFPLRYSHSRLDLAAVTSTRIIGVEIKSFIDTHERLEKQLSLFAPICHRLFAVLHDSWHDHRFAHEVGGRVFGYETTTDILKRVRDHTTGYHVPVWWVDPDAGLVRDRLKPVFKPAWRNLPPRPALAPDLPGFLFGPRARLWGYKLLGILHRAELLAIAERCKIKFEKRRQSHTHLVDLLSEELSGKVITSEVCHALRTRRGFAKLSDPPITVTS